LKELVVLSGKGGTGKTTLTACLSQLLRNSVLTDCDVDAPNLHILMNPETFETKVCKEGHVARIDSELCLKCGLCKSLCAFDAIWSVNGFPEVRESLCEGCGVCVRHCPEQAIEFHESLTGNLFSSKINTGYMFHARLAPGAENSGKLVAEVRRLARQKVLEIKADYILTDGPPGIGCPVISSLTGSDAALLVTEPTVSALHDLKRIGDLCDHFKIPAYVVINRADLNLAKSLEIQRWAMAKTIPVLGAIHNSPLFNEAQSENKILLDYAPDSIITQQIISIYENLNTILNPNKDTQ
jgi:MinD superfamily P-loop ATPase